MQKIIALNTEQIKITKCSGCGKWQYGYDADRGGRWNPAETKPVTTEESDGWDEVCYDKYLLENGLK